ncbi:MAG: DUF3037 domain-containing protein [Burkholderiales bacterium]
MTERNFNYVLLRAMPDKARLETLNAGIVVFAEQNTCVRIDASKKRLRILHPDLGRIDLADWAQQIQTELRKHPVDTQQMLLSFLCAPFIADPSSGTTIGASAEEQADFLFNRLVNPQIATLPPLKNKTIPHTKLIRELRDWLKASKIFSTKIEDLSKHRVIANYPVSPLSDLYADFALMNGKLHVIETLDLRGIDHLTQRIRGDAAIKGITLDEVSEDDNPIAVIAASDYSVAKPAISMISRFAKDVYDLSTMPERQRFADFMARSLHHAELALPLN